MFPAFRVGTLLGFPIQIRMSFLMMLGLIVLLAGGAVGLSVAGLAFVSILLHELGHAVTARRLGVTIRSIDFQFFGGAARMEGMPRSAGDEILIAAAGPAVSFVLAGAGAFLGVITGHPFFDLFGFVNLVIGVFNLLPALPMDGGRILRAVLAMRMQFLPATRLSVRIARWFALALATLGTYWTGNLLLIPLAIMLVVMGYTELAAAHVRGYGGERTDPLQDLWMHAARMQSPGFPQASDFPTRPAEPADVVETAEDEAGDVEYIPPGGRSVTERGGNRGSVRVHITRL